MRRSPVIFTPEMDALLCSLYPDTPNKEITRLTGWTTSMLKYNCERLGLKKTRACKAKTAGATEWGEEKIQFLKDNFFKLTNAKLAKQLGLRLTVTRNKAYELGLKKVELDFPWTKEQIQFLIDNYKSMGDVELAENIQKLWPRKRLWTKKHVNKKRYLLHLHRSPDEIQKIIAAHVVPGGRSYTIRQNSSTVNMQPGYIASLIAWRNKALQKEVLKYPELIKLKREQLLLNKAIREAENA